MVGLWIFRSEYARFVVLRRVHMHVASLFSSIGEIAALSLRDHCVQCESTIKVFYFDICRL